MDLFPALHVDTELDVLEEFGLPGIVEAGVVQTQDRGLQVRHFRESEP